MSKLKQLLRINRLGHILKIDTVCLVETPEGTDLQAEVVGVVPRFLAYSIDLLIRFAVILVLQMIFGIVGLGLAGQGFILIAYFLLEWWYPVIFEVYRGGQTIGKKAFKIKVVNDDLTPIQLSASLTRNLLRVADFLPLFYVFGFMSMVTNRRFQRLGDLAANSIVIYVNEEQYDVTGLEKVRPIASSITLTEDQQTAFVNFALNRGGLSSARQEEVAQIIKPRLPKNIDNASDYIRGVGKWLVGSK